MKDHFLPHAQLQPLIDALQGAGFSCVGPQVREGTIVYDVLTHADQLPWGVRDHQALAYVGLSVATDFRYSATCPHCSVG